MQHFLYEEGKFGVQYLAQRHYCMRYGGDWDQTANHLVMSMQSFPENTFKSETGVNATSYKYNIHKPTFCFLYLGNVQLSWMENFLGHMETLK